MTCASCTVHVAKALTATPGVKDASVNLLLETARVTYDPSVVQPEGLAAAVRAAGYESHVTEGDAADESASQDAAQAAEYRDLRRKAIVSLGAAALGMVVSMPVMSAIAASAHHASAPSDPLMLWSHAWLDPWLSAAIPWLYAIDPRWLLALLLAHHRGRDGLGGPSLLHARVVGLPAPRRRHEHAGGRRHRCGVPLLARRDAGARVLPVAGRRAGRVLRGRALHHRAHPRGQHVRGARETADLGRAARPRGPAAPTARVVARRRPGDGHPARPTWWRATWSSCGPASGCPWTARSWSGSERRGRVDADGRERAGAEEGRRHGDRRHHQPHGRPAVPGAQPRRRQRAQPDHPADA